MATGQNNNNRDPRPQNKIPNKRPANKRRREKVPGAVILIYILMILLVLAICALVFVITLHNTGWDGKNPGDVVISNDSSDSVPDSEPSNSSDTDSSEDDSGSSSDISDSSSTSEDPNSGSTPPESDPNSGSSTPQTQLPTNYDAEFFKDDLFIGDSIFTGLYLYGYLDNENVAAAVGYTPYNAMHKTFGKNYSGSAADYAAERKPKRIFIMLGSNSMAAGTNFDVMVTQYDTLLSSLKQNCPDSKICVISIPPVTSDSSAAASAKISNSDIKSVNVKLKKMTDSARVNYFDLNSMLSDDNGYFMDEYAEMDGLHFKGSTYKVLLSALQSEFKE